MSRKYPAVFQNQSTYGINTNLERDRLPKIPADAKVSYQHILTGGRQVPIRLCIAALQKTDDADDIARLVIGAMICGSGTPPAAAKLVKPHTGDYVETIKNWATTRYLHQVSTTAPSGETTASAANDETFPADSVPEWFREIEMDLTDFDTAWQASAIETAAYAGVLAYAIGKQPTAENLSAFNERRRNAIISSLPSGELTLFTDDSKFLTLDLLLKVHRCFNGIIIDRAIVFNAIIDHDDTLISGTSRSFYTMFRLTEGASLNPLLLITKFARKYPRFFKEFPELETEYFAAAHALQRFNDVKESRRMYLKVIFGSAYVPVDGKDINSLLGLAVFALQQSETSLSNYSGGQLSVKHRERLVELLGITTPVEETAPEQPAAKKPVKAQV